MSATVLVSGAGGFVGSAVVRCLVRGLAEGTLRFHDGNPVAHVVAIVRPGASLVRLESLLQGSPYWSVEYCDLADASALRRLLARRRPRAVIHLAMDRTAHTDEDDSARRRVIDVPLEEMFTGLAGLAGARVVFTSSAWVLPAGDRLDEQTLPQPVTVYGRNKLRAEQLLPVLHGRTGVDWINLRLFNIFGRYEAPSRLLPYLVDRLSQRRVAVLGNADAVRDFTDVDVIARAYVAAIAAAPTACAATYHIGSGRGITIRAFAMTVADVVGHAELIRVGEMETPDGRMTCQVANPALARKVLGWSAATDVYEHIRSAARWWLKRWEGVASQPAGRAGPSS